VRNSSILHLWTRILLYRSGGHIIHGRTSMKPMDYFIKKRSHHPSKKPVATTGMCAYDKLYLCGHSDHGHAKKQPGISPSLLPLIDVAKLQRAERDTCAANWSVKTRFTAALFHRRSPHSAPLRHGEKKRILRHICTNPSAPTLRARKYRRNRQEIPPASSKTCQRGRSSPPRAGRRNSGRGTGSRGRRLG